MRHKKAVGITHFPLQDEASRQERVPRERRFKDEPGDKKRGHRLSREQGSKAIAADENNFQGKGGTGGKSRGSRSGLLAANRKVRNRGR